MAENSKIEWCDHTFNPWEGCTKISAGCDHCYAEARAARWQSVEWGPGAPRRRTSAANWRKPIRWNKEARQAGRRARVFCASLADVFDAEVADDWRYDLFDLIGATGSLDWLLLTKRPNLAPRFTTLANSQNIWLGVSVENRKMAEVRIPHLLENRARFHFLSCEPLLEPLDLSPWLSGLDWVIVGGETGPGARAMSPTWARSIRDQCAAAGVAFFFKQMTQRAPIPGDLLVRQFPDQHY